MRARPQLALQRGTVFNKNKNFPVRNAFVPTCSYSPGNSYWPSRLDRPPKFFAMAVYMPTAGFDLISRATACVKSDPQTAQHHLDAIRKSVPILLEKLKQQEQQLKDERDEIEREEASLMRQIGNKEREMNKLMSDIKAIETNKARYEAAVDDAGRDLRSAQSKKRKAESDKSAATAGAVGGAVLGVLFPLSLLVKSDPQTAQHHLDAIRKSVPILLEKLKQQEQQLKDERDEIEREEASLMRQIGNKEREMNKLMSDIKAIETNKARYEAAVDDAGRDLRSAQSKKRKAESDKSAATAGAVGGAVLGVLFPLSLLVTVPTVVNAVKESDKEISRANDRVSDARSDIRREISEFRKLIKRFTKLKKRFQRCPIGEMIFMMK